MHRSSRIQSWLGGFLCGAVVLAALVLVCRTFLVQGLVAKVETASGSMAPWLLGPHGEAVCDTCGMKFVFDALDAPPRELLDCAHCGEHNARRLSQRTIAGEQVLVDRRAFTLRTPQRWEPIVFQCPDQASTLCIKRIVGLPREAVEIRHGDIYINGQIARKTLAEQQDMAILLHDSRWQTPDSGISHTGWLADKMDSGWQLSPQNFQHNVGNALRGVPSSASGESFPPRGTPQRAFPTVRSAFPTEVETIRFHSLRRGKSQSLLDDYAYNQNVSRQLNTVRDVMLAFDLTARGAGELHLIAEMREQRYEAVLSFTSQLLRVDGAIVGENHLSADFAIARSVVFSLFDQQVLLAIDGEPILRAESIHHAPRDAAPHAEREGYYPTVSIQAQNIHADLTNVRVLRDLYYTRPRLAEWGFDEPYVLGPEEYFVLGDNSPISADSRVWSSPALASKRIVGKPLRIER